VRRGVDRGDGSDDRRRRPTGTGLHARPGAGRVEARGAQAVARRHAAPSTEAEEPTSGGVAGRSATNLPSPDQGGFQLWIPLFFLACGIAGYFASRLLPARAGGAAVPPRTPSGEHWSAPPAGGVEPPPAPVANAPLPAHKPPADDPPPKLPSHRAPVRHRH
jgi:hypothetical protein